MSHTIPSNVLRLRSFGILLGAAFFLIALPTYAAVSTDTLSAYWKFDETSGTSAADASGDGMTATLTSGAAITTEIPTLNFTNVRGVAFDGVDDYVDVPDGFASFPSGLTFSLWAKPTAVTNWARFIDFGNGENDNNILWARDGVTNNMTFEVYNAGISGGKVTASNAITLNQWHHYVVTMTAAGSVKLYVDGVLLQTGTTTAPSSITRTSNFLGRSNWVADSYYQGQMDDVRIFKRVLSSREITELAAGNHPTQYWKGTTNTSFEGPGNWSGSFLPDPYTRITVLSRTNQPSMTGAVSMAGLTINTGAFLNVNSKNLTMNDGGIVTNYGTLMVKGSETFTGFTNDYSKGTVLVYGTGSYTGIPTGTAYYNLILNDGMVGYWKFDDRVGIRLPDNSGYSNSGTLVNTPAVSSVIPPTTFSNTQSASFNGSTQCAIIPSAILPYNVSQFTVSAWVNANALSGGGTIFYKDATNGEAILGNYNLEGGTMVSKWVATIKGNDAGWYSAVPAATAVTGQWYHLAMVYRKGDSLKLYVNGALAATRSLAGLTGLYVQSGFISSIGCYNNSGLYFNGKIDDVRWYNRAISPAEIATLALGNQPSTGIGTITLGGLTTVNGTFTLNGGTLDVSTSSYGLVIGKNWLNNGGKFLARSSTVTFSGTTSGLDILSGGQSFAKITFNGSGGAWTVRDRFTASGTTVLTSGTLDASTDSYTMRFGQFVQNGGTIVPQSGVIVLTNHQNTTNTFTSTLNTLRLEDPLENGLVGYWKLDEGTNSGAIVDSTRLNSVGVRRGTGAIWTSSVPSAIAFDNPFAMQFNGAPGDAVSIPVTSNFPSNPTNITQAVWMKTTTGCGQLVLVTRRNQSLSINSDWATLFVVNGSVVFNLDDRSYGHSTAGVRVDDGLWHHVAGVKTGTTYSLYVDGTFRDSFTDAHSMDGSSGLNYNIGLAPNWAGSNFIGSIDDVRVYNRSLSPGEIMNLARGHYAAGNNSTATVSLGDNLSVGTLALDSGNLSMGSMNLSVSNNFTLTRGDGTLTGGVSYMSFGGNVTLSGSSITGNSSSLNIDGNVQMFTGSLVAPGYVYLNGNLLKSGGILDVTNFILDGGNQTLTGSLAFYNLTKTVTSPYTLSIASGYPVTVTGALVLKGDVANLLSLRSTSPGVAATLRLASTGTQDIQYGDIGDSDATGGVTLQCLTSNGCLNSGNNTNWFFGVIATAPTTDSTPPSGGGGGHGGARGHGTSLQHAISVRTALIQNFAQQIAANTSSAATSVTKSSARSERTVIAQAASSAQSRNPEKGMHIAEQRGKLLVAMTDRDVIYKDVSVNEWFAPYVSKLIVDGIAQGYKDTKGALTGEFGVANYVTRAEMLKMALEAAGKKSGSEQPPRNLSAKGSWASPYVGLAEKMQLTVFGVTTDINAPATRGEVVQTILEAMGITVGNTPAGYTDVPKNYPYTNAIAAATFFGVVEGDTDADGKTKGTFRPESPINRAEVSKMIALAATLLK